MCKRILVTGARKGLGGHLKQFLEEKELVVYGTSRNPDSEVDDSSLRLYQLDLACSQSISRLADKLINDKIQIDAIIHNAGKAYLDPIEVLSEEELRHIFDVNFFGPVRLTKLLLPILKKGNCPKLIFISSIVAVDCWPYLGAYAASKRAIESAAFEWAILLKRYGIGVSIIQPNPLPTNMDMVRSINADTSPYPELKERKLIWENINEVLKLVLEILQSPNPRFQYQTGSHSRATAESFLNLDQYANSLKVHQDKLSQLLSHRSS